MIAPMTQEHAQVIAAWAYEGEYAVYDLAGDAGELLNGEYCAQTGESGEVEGYFCFGASARIPAGDGAYPEDALDVGLGRRPDLCGQGAGVAFVRMGTEFARTALGAKLLRLTVAAFNARAIRAYEKAGFRRVRTVKHGATGMAFWVMVSSEDARIGTDSSENARMDGHSSENA